MSVINPELVESYKKFFAQRKEKPQKEFEVVSLPPLEVFQKKLGRCFSNGR